MTSIALDPATRLEPTSRWNRWRRWLGPVLVITVLFVALHLLQEELARLHYQDIVAAVRSIGRERVVIALAFTALSYLALPGYDLLALHYAGHPLPYRRAAFGSVIAYGISQTLGLPALTGGSVRARLWSGWGLTTTEVARAVAFAGATFVLGVVTLSGVIGLTEPAASLARLHLPAAPVRALSLGCLSLTVAYIAWSVLSRGRPFRVGRVVVPVPSVRVVAAQLGVVVVDWTLAALVLFALLPPGHGLRFPAVLAAFLLAQTAGLISHVPGGLGVFETLMFLQLGGTIGTGPLVGILLAYRFVYYLVPFGMALVLLVTHELTSQRQRLARAATVVAGGFERWAEPIVPTAIGVMTLVGGAMLLWSGATPPIHSRFGVLIDALPLGIVELSHFTGSIVGAALLVLGWALTRRLDAGFQLARALLILGIAASLLKGLDWEEGAVLALVLVVLVSGRDAFYRKASLLSEPLTPGWLAAILAIVGVSIWVGLFTYKHVEYRADLWWRFTERGDAPRFLRASAGAAVLLGMVGTLRLLRYARPRLTPPTEKDLMTVAGLLPAIEETSAALALLGDKYLLVSDSRDGFLMYGVSGRSWVALGDPCGPDATRRELAWRFVEIVDEQGGWPVFYEISARYLPLYVDLGLTLLKMGEEAIVPLRTFSLDGGDRKGLRRTERDLQKAGAGFEVVEPSLLAPLLPELAEVSDDWIRSKATREKGFSLGRFDPRYLAHFPHAIVRTGGRIVAFANLWTGSGVELSLDLMRYRHDAPPGTMDYLLIELMLWGKGRGFERMNLGMAPLSGLESRALAPRWHRAGGLLYRHGEHFYNFQGLRRYKAKFDPTWEPRYLATPAGLALPRILTNVASLISGGLGGIVTR